MKDHGQPLVEETGEGLIVATPAGRDKMPAGFKPIPKTPAKMREHYLATLPGGEVDVLRVLLEHPAGLTREELNAKTDYRRATPTSCAS